MGFPVMMMIEKKELQGTFGACLARSTSPQLNCDAPETVFSCCRALGMPMLWRRSLSSCAPTSAKSSALVSCARATYVQELSKTDTNFLTSHIKPSNHFDPRCHMPLHLNLFSCCSPKFNESLFTYIYGWKYLASLSTSTKEKRRNQIEEAF
jgi:hypothetical protein